MKLKAPSSWWRLSEEEKNSYRGAVCGPGRGWLAMLVPDDLYGLDIREA